MVSIMHRVNDVQIITCDIRFPAINVKEVKPSLKSISRSSHDKTSRLVRATRLNWMKSNEWAIVYVVFAWAIEGSNIPQVYSTETTISRSHGNARCITISKTTRKARNTPPIITARLTNKRLIRSSNKATPTARSSR